MYSHGWEHRFLNCRGLGPPEVVTTSCGRQIVVEKKVKKKQHFKFFFFTWWWLCIKCFGGLEMHTFETKFLECNLLNMPPLQYHRHVNWHFAIPVKTVTTRPRFGPMCYMCFPPYIRVWIGGQQEQWQTTELCFLLLTRLSLLMLYQRRFASPLT